jgi:hypothetical protein
VHLFTIIGHFTSIIRTQLILFERV